MTLGVKVRGDDGHQLAAVDDFGVFPICGKVAAVAGEQVIGAGSVGAFEEDVVVGIAALGERDGGVDQTGARREKTG